MSKAPATQERSRGSASEFGQSWAIGAARPSLVSRNGVTQAPFQAPPRKSLDEQLAAMRRERDEFQQMLYGAAQLQRKLCAPREMRCGPFEISSEIFPVRHLSGDFYTVLEADGSTVVAVGDIAGKGLSAGLWFAHLLGLIRIFAGSISDLADAVSAVNVELCRVTSEPPMAAVFFARLDPQRSELVYCNAGQPAALLLRRASSTESLQTGGPLLGAVPQAAFSCGRAAFEPGDTLIAYSDGVIECRNAHEEEFGRQRLLAAARGAAEFSSSTLLFSVLGAVQDFAHGRPPEDDLTMMVVSRLGPAASRESGAFRAS